MRIVMNQEMRNLDKMAIEELGIPSIVLMENAGLGAARIISQWYQEKKFQGEIIVCCGKGKNGGDGLVVARHLLMRGHRVRIFLCHDPLQISEESKTNLQILKNMKSKINIVDSPLVLEEYFKSASPPYLVVDAILGTGLDRTLEGDYLEIIELLNQKATDIIALDIPSGVKGDSGETAGGAIRASATVSFGYPRIGHFNSPGAALRGQFFNIDLGYPRKWAREGDKYLLVHDNVAPLIQRRNRFGHKNSFGHCLLIGGSPGRLGAIEMASQSCLKMGTGLVTVASWQDCFPTLELKVSSEVMTFRMKVEDAKVPIPVEGFLNTFSSIVIGPGLGVRPEGAYVLQYLLENFKGPIVIDADGLNIVAEHQLHRLLMNRPESCILTPHPGEMARLLRVDKSSVVNDPVSAVKKAVDLTGSIIALKGATTLIHSTEGITYFNHYPNDGMAKAGSGDVLAGMVGGLVGQKMPQLDSVRIAVYAHTLAGRLAAESFGERSMTAKDITAHISAAFRDLSVHQTQAITNDVLAKLF